MLSIGTTFYRDAEDGLGLLDGDVQVAVVVGHDARGARLVQRGLAVLQPLHRLVPPDPSSLLQERPTLLLHVEAP